MVIVPDICCLGNVDHHFLWCLYSRKEVAVSPSKDRSRSADKRLRATSPNAAEAHDVAPGDSPYDIRGVERLCAITVRLQEPIPNTLCDRIAQDGDVVVGDEFGLGVLHQNACGVWQVSPDVQRGIGEIEAEEQEFAEEIGAGNGCSSQHRIESMAPEAAAERRWR